MAVMACQAGKHVYSEKPACRTIEEGRAMINASRRYKKVVQIGAQGRSNPNARSACQYVRNGMLGKVSHVEILHPDNPTNQDLPTPQEPPTSLDWNLWLGPARWRPYHRTYHPGSFRWFMGIGGGQIRDRGNHAMSIACWLMNHDGYQGSVRVESHGNPQASGMYDVPLNLVVNYRFSDPDWTMTWRQLADIPKSHAPWGATYRGDRDSLIVTQGDGACDTEAKAKSYVPPSGGEVYLHPAPEGTNTTDRHHLNFLDCIRTGQRPASDVEYIVKACYLCILGNISWLLGRPVTFDYATERFVNDAEADRLISDPMRAPWKI
jgi:predicted dehydrogenase